MNDFNVNQGQVTLENIGGGACTEKFGIELERVIENILDPNTDSKAREIVLRVKIKPSDKNRTQTGVEVHCYSKLSNPVEFTTNMFVGSQRGALVAFEHNPDQMTFDDVSPELDQSNVVAISDK